MVSDLTEITYVTLQILVNQEDHQSARNHQDPRNRGPARKLSISGLSHDQIRTNVINEIISTERDFVKHLRDVIKVTVTDNGDGDDSDKEG